MTLFQLLMLGASAYFAYKIYEHVQTLKDPEEHSNDRDSYQGSQDVNVVQERTADSFSTFLPEVLVERADEAYENDDLQKALALLHEADAKAPNNDEILFKIAYILQKSGDDEEALKYYKKALEIDKNNEFIHNSMASIFRSRGEFTSAKMHLKSSLDIDDSNPVTYYNYGNLLVDMQHNEEAVEMYERALELDPEFNEARDEIEKLKE
jgi:tetratricopeptide (TPR) repeat protein